MRFIMAYTTYS